MCLINAIPCFRCEVRPGPEFVLRRYFFFKGYHFDLYQFYYDDPHCTRPQYAVRARGHAQIYQRSWTIPGATEFDYQLNHVAVVPYTKKAADRLGARVNRTCPGYAMQNWAPRKRYEIFNYAEVGVDEGDGIISHEEAYVLVDRDCMAALDFSLHELQLMRVELHVHSEHVKKMLYLGDIHTERNERQTYRPTSFQEPLAEVHVGIDREFFRVYRRS